MPSSRYSSDITVRSDEDRPLITSKSQIFSALFSEPAMPFARFANAGRTTVN